MNTLFHNRAEAGERLAEKLTRYCDREDVIVLALPRGGVPVGAVVARKLGVPLDVLTVRKLGVPGNEELAIGAIASGGVRLLNEAVIDAVGISPSEIDDASRREAAELERRELAYRGFRAPAAVRKRTVILVDDGVATGSTMLAAIAALRRRQAQRIVVAVPTIAASTLRKIEAVADAVVAVLAPEDFSSVGQWYESFNQTSDDEVRALLEAAAEPDPVARP